MNGPSAFPFDATAIAWLIVLLAAVFVPSLFVKTVGENECIIVERMGRYFGCRGRGRYVVIPFLDRVIRIDLDAALPGWQGMTPQEIERKVIEMRYGAGHGGGANRI